MEIDITKYLPVAAAILSATLGYIFGIRTKKNERLVQFTQENVKEVFSPMYHEMKRIIENPLIPKNRELMLDTFFERYLVNNTPVYKLGNLELLDTFYELSEKYRHFKLSRDEDIWKEVWWDFENNLFCKVKEGYRNSTNLLYSEFTWEQYTQTKPYWMKFYLESMKFLFETAKGLNIVSLLLVYFSGCFKIFRLGLFPSDFWLFSLLILVLSIVVTLILIPFNMQYITLTSNSKQSFFRRVVKKAAPKILTKWDNFLINKDYNDVPKMYKKRFLEDK
ncbi:hypothetical protein J25TS5_20050 [Paenibacillus faecis]|uniref:hypothetical protein n=1 Tax=Paenibacillus faecis TaxID=862114 RepID=UPI001B15192D|nr:hypothetical protein [Paenibacillus faecis]GIO85073.1 hypothetical protein J25TS5_20050 [Paenibacillus faecis]